MSWFTYRLRSHSTRAVALTKRNASPKSKLRRQLDVEKLEPREVPASASEPLPVLMVIANQDFYYREYAEPRAAFEAAGLSVEVAAATLDTAAPHWNSGQGADGGFVEPDLRLQDADADDYSAIVFVGGWGSSMYQYSFEGTYYNGNYNGALADEAAANRLINDFLDQDKYVTAICHGVAVLAWARVDGVSPIEGKNVTTFNAGAPEWIENTGQFPNTSRWHVEVNGGIMPPSGSVGDPATVADDVIVDGRIITAENYDSAPYFGQVVAQHILADVTPPDPGNTAPGDLTVVGPALGVRGHVVVFSGTFVDPDVGDTHTLAWQIRNAAAKIVASGSGTSIEFTPQQLGAHTATFQVTDAAGASAAEVHSFQVRGAALVPSTSAPGQMDLQIGGTNRHDVIRVIPTGRAGEVRVLCNGAALGNFRPTGNIVVHAGAGNDVVEIDPRLKIAAWVDGGAGRDHLRGGRGNDVLLGGAGDDRLESGAGRNLLVGETGSDTLIGKRARDLLFQEFASFPLTPDAIDEALGV